MKKTGNILLVDDDDTNNFYVTHILKKMKICDKIYSALNGQEALDKIIALGKENIYIDLIFLDINMPLMNGFEFLEAYEEFPPHLKSKTIVSMISSSRHSNDFKRSQTYENIDCYIEKPLTEDKMNQIIASINESE